MFFDTEASFLAKARV